MYCLGLIKTTFNPFLFNICATLEYKGAEDNSTWINASDSGECWNYNLSKE